MEMTYSPAMTAVHCNACGKFAGNGYGYGNMEYICKGCAVGAEIKTIFCKVIGPLALIGFAFLLAYWPLHTIAPGPDLYLKTFFCAGIPFGVHRMSFYMVPHNYDLGGTLGIWVFNLLIGGVIGVIVIGWRILVAAFVLLRSPFRFIGIAIR